MFTAGPKVIGVSGPLPDGSSRLRRIRLDRIIDRRRRTTEERVTGCTGSVDRGTAEFLRSIKEFATQVVSAYPEASVAWAAVCLVLSRLTNHFDAEEDNREGFTYTIHRMQYHSAFEPLVLVRDDHSKSLETFKLATWKELRANNDKAKAPLNQDLELVTASALLLEAKSRNSTRRTCKQFCYL